VRDQSHGKEGRTIFPTCTFQSETEISLQYQPSGFITPSAMSTLDPSLHFTTAAYNCHRTSKLITGVLLSVVQSPSWFVSKDGIGHYQ